MRKRLLFGALAMSVCATPALADPLIIIRHGNRKIEVPNERSLPGKGVVTAPSEPQIVIKTGLTEPSSAPSPISRTDRIIEAEPPVVLDSGSPEPSSATNPISRTDRNIEAEPAKEVEPVVQDLPVEEVPPIVREALPPRPVRRQPIAWLEASALSWRIKDGPLSTPLITTGSATDPIPGALGQPGTRLAFGGSGLDYGQLNGYRVSAGAWLANEPVGIELSMFQLDKGGTIFPVRSDTNGSPPIYLPAFNVATQAEGSLLVADPLLAFSGGVVVQSESRLQGWEANVLVAVTRSEWADVDLLVGYRSMSLKESLFIRNQSEDLIFGTFNDSLDRFYTNNDFNGGQIGLRATGYCGNWFAAVTGKVAFGPTRSEVTVNGVTTQTAIIPVPTGIFPSGVFAQPSNIGTQTQIEWSAVSELNLRAGYDAFGCLRAFVGVDLLCWNSVARPGDQIDRALNLTQSPVFGGGIPIGQRSPTPRFQPSDFFAQGLSAGIELRY